MDRKKVAEQQAKLAEHRKQQQHTKQTERTTSSSKEIDPSGQPFKEKGSLKPDFQKAHDNAIGHGEKKGPQVSPQLRDQDAARPTPQQQPAPPKSTGPEANRRAHFAKLKQTNEQAKARQEQAERGNMKDGKDHD